MGNRPLFLRKALISYSPELAAGQMVRFLFLACEAPENNGSFPLVHHVPENYGAGGAADERNWLYYKMWGSSTAYRGGVGCLFSFLPKEFYRWRNILVHFFRDFSLKCLPDWSAGIIIDFKTLNRERRFTVAVYWEKRTSCQKKRQDGGEFVTVHW